MAESEYIRLPGKRRFTTGFTRNTLMLGKDHLLHVINRGYTEDYRRFYYSDIQAILVRQTITGRIINIVLGTLAAIGVLFFVIGVFRWQWEKYAWIPWGVATFLWVILFLYYALAGPTCVCHLRTAVQFETLPSLFRVKTARKALQQLRQRIESEQGTLVSEIPSS